MGSCISGTSPEPAPGRPQSPGSGERVPEVERGGLTPGSTNVTPWTIPVRRELGQIRRINPAGGIQSSQISSPLTSHWQRKRERGPFSYGALHPDPASMELDESAREG